MAAAGIAFITTTVAFAQSTPPPRDRVQTPPTGTAIVKGRVIDAQTGMALARARVRLQGPGNRPPALTDETGAFRLTEAPAGIFYLSIERSGYMAARVPEPGRTVRASAKPLVVVDGQTLDAGVVRLYRGGVIAGRISDLHGEPAEFVQILVLRLPSSGHGTPQQRGGGSTNDLGEFRLPRLEAGRYLVRAQTRNTAPDDPTETQPVPTYYPGVASMDQAQSITIERGQVATGVEFMVLDGTSSAVSGTVVDAKGEPLSSGAYVNARTLNDIASDGMTFGGAGVRQDGTFRLKLAPGEYQLEVQAPQTGISGPDGQQFGRLRISVGSAPLSGLTVTMGPGATMSGKLVFEGESPLPASLDQITIGAGQIPGGGNCQSGRGVTIPDGTFRVQGILGTCAVRAMGNIGRWAIKSVTRDDVDLMDRPIAFEPGQRLTNVRVVLTDRRTALELEVTDERGLPTREYVAMVFTQDRTKWNEMSQHVRLYLPPAQVAASPGRGTNGSATVTAARAERRDALLGLPPGEYYAVAVEDLPMEGARDADVLESLAGDAVRLTLTDAAPARVSLRRRAFSAPAR
jgi:carboxypeptidase family protein